MKKCLIFVAFCLLFKQTFSQLNIGDTNSIRVNVINESNQPLAGASLEVIDENGKNLLRTAIADSAGSGNLSNLLKGNYQLTISHAGYQSLHQKISLPAANNEVLIFKLLKSGVLDQVSVTALKPFIQHEQGKVLINVDALASSAGITILEVLEKSPGVTVDKNGTISLQGKPSVQIFIDGRQTFLSGSDLNNMLSSMSSSQVEQIELIGNPSAKYDAGGNAGIINIKTKKNRQEGFNGNLSLSVGQGRYSKTNNTVVLNYRKGKVNAYATISANLNNYFTNVYALRKYFDADKNLTATLDQPTYFTGTSNNQSVKGGIDYFISKNTTLGVGVTGILFYRRGESNAAATWLGKNGNVDSSIITTSTSSNSFKNTGTNINFRHVLSQDQEVTINADWLNYDLNNKQYFANWPFASATLSDASTGRIPSAIQILSLKGDHNISIGKSGKIESGFKHSDIKTNNLADYTYFDGTASRPDYGKSNHFLYNEQISALYTSLQQQAGRLNIQAGLRYEKTNYNANQLGNPLRKDSAFSRKYAGVFPSGSISYAADSANTFSFTTGRRIDRPAFQKLNPFIFIINKYTYQSGNPFFLPQYSWNFEVTHQYKSVLTTTLSYSSIKNYFSQLFLTDDDGLLYYSEGNIGKASVAGVSVSAELLPAKWWNLSAQTTYNYKQLTGMVYHTITSSVNQLSLTLTNQFKLGKKYTGELSGFYISRSRNDLQEILSPAGQATVAFSRPVFKDKGSLKLSFRDIFYTVIIEGNTQFENATEYFNIKRDSRVVTLGFTYRFGKMLKTNNRQNGGANDEIDRVGAGN